MNNEVTVLIPAHNEEKTIKKVIDIAKNSTVKSNIIVIDNCSDDKTSEVAHNNGAKVISCNNKGKGEAMLCGLQQANTDIIVYLDADIINYESNIIEKLVNPIIYKDIDFVKSTFNRTEGGIVTEVMVKPLLRLLFPNIYKFSEPISGIVAGKKSCFENSEFEKDYGVDIGILLDMINNNAKIEEVNIGDLINGSHKNKTLEYMNKMSSEIMKAILKRYNKMSN